MKTLNELILEYTERVRQGELLTAYRGILEYMGRLRRELATAYPDYEVGNSIYQGYMDMSYFPVSTTQLNEKGLKIAIVYLHAKGTFEIWLSARNREMLKKYEAILEKTEIEDLELFHDSSNKDAIVEYTLLAEPDFDEQEGMSAVIMKETQKFITVISAYI